MGYTTEFYGEVHIDPPLNEYEKEYLLRFAGSRRMDTSAGPYFADPGDDFGQGGWDATDGGEFRSGVRINDYNRPPRGQPGLWCQWVPDEHGENLIWDGGEKFYNAPEWMKYLIQHFLMPEAATKRLRDQPALSREGYANWDAFTYDHRVDGTIQAQGEEPNDQWLLVVENNVVKVAGMTPVTFGEPREV